MTREEMLAELKDFVGRELLDGRDAGLNERTPLLEWGVIDSLSVAELLSFTSERFQINVPQDEVSPENLTDLDAYVGLLLRLVQADVTGDVANAGQVGPGLPRGCGC